MNFVSEEQLDKAKRTRGERIEDGTAQRDRPLFEILKENKDKKDAEFNERFKHRPPKALDKEETEFLEKLEMSRKKYEQQIADEEAQQLQRFQAAVEAQSKVMHELKEPLPLPKIQETILPVKKKPTALPLRVMVKPKPPTKKSKLYTKFSTDLPGTAELPDSVKTKPSIGCHQEMSIDVLKPALLVSYSDESDED